MAWLLAVSALLSISVTCQATYYSSCPNEWVAGPNNHCYYFSTSGLTWFEASFECRKRGGHLARISNSDKIVFLKSQAKARGQCNYWVGGTDYFHEGKWIWWPTQDPVGGTCTDWAPNEPNNDYDGQHCLQLWAAADYKWDDHICRTVQNYICETYVGSTNVCTCSPKD